MHIRKKRKSFFSKIKKNWNSIRPNKKNSINQSLLYVCKCIGKVLNKYTAYQQQEKTRLELELKNPSHYSLTTRTNEEKTPL